MSEPWERQKGETTKAFAAFVVYRNMQPLERSHAKTHRATGIPESTIAKWSAKYNWVKRVEAWDNEQDRQARAAQMEEIKSMRKNHANIASAMLVKAAQALQRIPPDEIKARDISMMVETASKLERISRGDSGDVIEQRDGGTAISPVQFYIPDNKRSKGDEDE